MTQARFVCHECHRQWVHAQNWTLGMNCPACGSQSPTLEIYTPVFPGADYAPSDAAAVGGAPPVTIDVPAEPNPLIGALL